jgi:Uma2 family endonuclease
MFGGGGFEMPATLTPPIVRPSVRTRFTVTEFHHLRELPEVAAERPFLLHGVIWEQGPMKLPHGNGVLLTTDAVRAAFGAGWVLRVQLPLVLGQETDPFPDLAVVPGSVRDYTEHPTTAALVVEVSDTTLRADLTEKAEAYATAGIADYWVLDVIGRELHVLRDPGPLAASLGATAYRQHTTHSANDTVSPLAAPTATIRVADVLP